MLDLQEELWLFHAEQGAQWFKLGGGKIISKGNKINSTTCCYSFYYYSILGAQ